jgi:hypothetical protein
MTKRLCVLCNQYLSADRFEPAHPDFPTRDGYNFNCRACVATQAPYRLKRVGKKVEEDTEYTHHKSLTNQALELATLV